jgi:hypothetical protein
MADIPVLYFSFANQADQHLPFLEEELGAIERKLRNKDARNKIKFKKEAKTKVADIFEALPFYREDLVLFHYAGHASGTHLQFTDGLANTAGLAGFFKDYKKLKLVFLNGCSTQDQVLGFLEGGVDAVIATSVPVNDRRATDFAIQFYHALNVGDSLEVAYNHAVQSIRVQGEMQKEPIALAGEILELEKVKIGENAVTYEYNLLAAPVAVRGQALPTFAGVIPWGLYYRTPEVLAWKLADAFPVQEEVDFKAISLARKEEQLISQIARLDEIDKQITALSVQAIALNDNDPALLDLNSQLNHDQTRKRKLERDINGTQLAIQELKLGEEAKIRTAINQINYKDQIDFFAEWKNKQQVGAFLIQGTMRCGHDFLVGEVAPKQVLNFTQDRFQDIWVYFDDLSQNNTFTKDALWKNARMALRMRPARDQIEQKVTEEIKRILQKQHLLLVFDGVTHLAAKAICEFWNHLLNLLRPAHLNLQNAYPNRLILLLLDRNAELSITGDTAVSEPKFAAAFASAPSPEFAPIILNPIRPLDQQALKSWLIDSDLPDELLPDAQMQASLLAESEGYVIPMIRSFCEQIGKPDLFEKYYVQFDLE